MRNRKNMQPLRFDSCKRFFQVAIQLKEQSDSSLDLTLCHF
jgi:hypothetical protein